MSKNIDRCAVCNENYCADCVYGDTCLECGQNTCGDSDCIDECDHPGGCGDMICEVCRSTHDCTKTDEDDRENE